MFQHWINRGREANRRSRRAQALAGQPALERMEDRQLMTVNTYVVGTGSTAPILMMIGTAGNDRAVVTETASTVTVTSRSGSEANRVQTFSKLPGMSLAFGGGFGHDYFENRTALPSGANGGEGKDTLYGGSGIDRLFGDGGDDFISGGSGNDVLEGGSGQDNLMGDGGNDVLRGGDDADLLQGGSGHDTLEGGTGNDVLRGGTGNDNLYGGGDNDSLFGDDGHDGLFGGEGVDSLFGGAGSDRFLVWKDQANVFGILDHNETLADVNGNDAKIYFERSDGGSGNTTYTGGSWTAEEIERVDRALADLHLRRNDVKLLKTSLGFESTFRRGRDGIGEDTSVAGINSAGTITLLDLAFGSDDLLAHVVFHEIGHNWEEETVNWETFKSFSGWREKTIFDWTTPAGFTLSNNGKWFFRTGSSFVSQYARTSPKEDFAETFAAHMMQRTGRPSVLADPTAAQNKVDFVRAIIDTL